MSEPASIDIVLMKQKDAETIAAWRYDPPYDFYDADAGHRDLAELLDARQRSDTYFSAFDQDGALIAYFGFVPAGEVVGVGVGLRPDLTGRGLGGTFLEAGLDYARRRFAPRRFRLVVAAFNARAITVYRRAGFIATRTYERETDGRMVSFVEMERPE